MTAPMPLQTSARVVRELLGLTLEQVAADIREQGVPITRDGLNNIELGRRPGSEAVLLAYSRALNIRRTHLRQSSEFLEWADGQTSRPRQSRRSAVRAA